MSPPRLLDWRRQRTIRYPWHVCAPSNENWLSFTGRRSMLRRGRRRVGDVYAFLKSFELPHPPRGAA